MSRQRESPADDPIIADDEVEQHIREFFDRNYDQLRQEGGHVLAEGAKRQALQQSLLYWRKLKEIATSVTETEVKLALPGQATPKGRPFVIEGIVDIVREGDKVLMYDLKTYEEGEVRAERRLYEDQLNVYAHIWKGIRRQKLDGTAIIATRLPAELREALRSGDPGAIAAAMEVWQPVVDLPFNEKDVQRTIADFGRCVDEIEDGVFTPRSPQVLSQPAGTRRRKDHGMRSDASSAAEPTFAQIHCQNCDGRFSCAAYRTYQRTDAGRARRLVTGAAEEDIDEQRELDEWIEINLANDDGNV
jgi:PD-(D/E)XK nuclease superfamily